MDILTHTQLHTNIFRVRYMVDISNHLLLKAYTTFRQLEHLSMNRIIVIIVQDVINEDKTK